MFTPYDIKLSCHDYCTSAFVRVQSLINLAIPLFNLLKIKLYMNGNCVGNCGYKNPKQMHLSCWEVSLTQSTQFVLITMAKKEYASLISSICNQHTLGLFSTIYKRRRDIYHPITIGRTICTQLHPQTERDLVRATNVETDHPSQNKKHNRRYSQLSELGDQLHGQP